MRVAAHHILTDTGSKGEVEAAHDIRIRRQDFKAGLADSVASFFTHADELDVFSFGRLRPGGVKSLGDEHGVEAAAQAAIRSSQNDHRDMALGTALEKRMSRAVGLGRKIAEHSLKLFRVGAETLNAGLGAAQLRRGHHVHGLGDLLGLTDPDDLHFDVFQRRHALPSPRHYSLF